MYVQCAWDQFNDFKCEYLVKKNNNKSTRSLELSGCKNHMESAGLN